MRQVDQLDMLQADIADDEYLFGDKKLSKREKKQLDYKKTVYNLAQDYKKAGERMKVDRYTMQTEGTKPSKYDDEVIIEELSPNYEQKQWEEDKLGQAKMKFGAKDAKSKNKVCVWGYSVKIHERCSIVILTCFKMLNQKRCCQVKDYDLMVEEEEQIAFVLAENVPGTVSKTVGISDIYYCLFAQTSILLNAIYMYLVRAYFYFNVVANG